MLQHASVDRRRYAAWVSEYLRTGDETAEMKQVFGLLIIFAAVSITLLLLRLNEPGALHADTGAANRVSLELALSRYKALAQNMTQRIRVAEQALLQLKGRQVAKRASLPLPAAADGGSAGDSDRSDKGSGFLNGPPGDLDSPEETEEERQKRLEEELKEQHQLIGYDGATKTFRQRWRSDFRCGDRAPLLPDETLVECEPAGEAPCCSNLGWCGKSPQHCTCDVCQDFSSKVKLRLDETTLHTKKRECQDVAFNFGDIKTPDACAKLVLDKAECGRMFMFPPNYPDWGCRCCTGGSGVTDEQHDEWMVYQIKVSVVS